jgi:hypothetical protein
VKVFEDVEIFDLDQEEGEGEKQRKMRTNKTVSNFRKGRENRKVTVHSNMSMPRGLKRTWKMDDIFLGFK